MAHARLILIVALGVLAASCGSTAAPTGPTSTTTVTAQPSTWTGLIDITSCTGAASSCATGPQAFALRLAAGNSGVLQIDADGTGAAPAWAISVSGTVFGGITLLTGSSAGGRESSMRTIDVSMTLTSPGDPSNATINYTLSANSASTSRIGHVAFAVRDATIYGSRFQGEWQGYATRTQCTGACTLSDSVMRSGDVRLSLSQSGASVTGLLNGIQISGTASGTGLSVTTHFAVAANQCHAGFDNGVDCVIDVTFSVTVDDFDRLHGSIAYSVSGVDDANRPYSYSGSGTLDGVARWP